MKKSSTDTNSASEQSPGAESAGGRVADSPEIEFLILLQRFRVGCEEG